ncbi:non-lysosomal glucosylceramidase [Dorcoceras hygrometricum]|uniref:Non-lysosomal glucosylceramidase n=1 Tax=Dorcoceras hygrometricum TaxID=472368 RepID=A0A2Z7CD65_9LAMI|nr:non-lysosomal glucosylceramidase [Dorcoceras hygrometricum]
MVKRLATSPHDPLGITDSACKNQSIVVSIQYGPFNTLATSPHDPLGITDSACKNQSIVVSIQYGPFNTYISIRSTTIGKSRVARDPITMHTSWRSNSDIASVTRQTNLPKKHPVLWTEIYHTIISSDSIGYPRMKASGESSTTKHRLLHASRPHPIPPPNDPN